MRVVIFTEGGGTYGFGHLTRCQALYQALAEQGVDVTMIMRGEPEAVYLLRGCRAACFDWLLDEKRLRKSLHGVDCAVVDSYHAERTCYERIAAAVRRLVCLDDTQRIPYPESATILNGGISASPAMYPGHRGDVLTGAAYALLRRVFWDVVPAQPRELVRTALVTLGGTDVRGLTDAIIGSLLRTIPESATIHVIGGVRDGIRSTANQGFIRHEQVSEPELLALMSSVDIAVCAGGQTLYELARLGVPAVAVRVADNQHANVSGFAAAGCIKDAGRWDDPDIPATVAALVHETLPWEMRCSMHRVGTTLIDGQGARRTSACIIQKLNAHYADFTVHTH